MLGILFLFTFVMQTYCKEVSNLDSSHQFIDCSSIGTDVIQRNDIKRIVVVDHTICLAFSPTEFKLLVPLLSGQMMVDNELSYAATGCDIEQWKRANLKRYIDKLRSKIRPAGLDVGRIQRHGYVLLSL